MAEQTVFCEECVEDIPANEVYWDEGRLYCGRCGSEVQPPDKDIFEEIVDNRSRLLFRDHEPPEVDDEEEEEEGAEEDEAEAEAEDEEEDDGGVRRGEADAD